MPLFKKIIAIALLLIIPIGCSFKNSTDDEDRVKTTILKYNRGIIEAYRDLNPNLLAVAASERQAQKVGVIVSSFLQADRVMEAELVSVEFKGISVFDEGKKAAVRTVEEWDYRWVDVNTRAVVVPRRHTRYEINYKLVLKDGNWIVDGTESLSEKTTEAASADKSGMKD